MSKKIVALLLATTLCAGALSGCKLGGSKEQGWGSGAGENTHRDTTESNSSTADTSTENTTDDPLAAEGIIYHSGDDFALYIFPEADSEQYKDIYSMGERIEGVEGADDSNQLIRFVVDTDGVDVRCEAIIWEEGVFAYHASSTSFDITAEALKVYEFPGIMGDGEAYYRITARKGDHYCDWFLMKDYDDVGYYAINSYELEYYLPEDYSLITNLARLYAMKCVYAGGDIREMPEYFWGTIAESVSSQLIGYGDVDQDILFEQNAWVIDQHIRAFYSLSESGSVYPQIQETDPIVYYAEPDEYYSDGHYEIQPIGSDYESYTSFLYSEYEGDEPVIYISVTDSQGSEITVKVLLGLDMDLNYPFTYYIKGYEIVPAVG